MGSGDGLLTRLLPPTRRCPRGLDRPSCGSPWLGSFPPLAVLEQSSAESKNPDDKLTGVFVLATSYSRTACRRTTIGAAAFHFRVRNGNGWGHCARVTRVQSRDGGSLLIAATQARGRISGDIGRLRSIAPASKRLSKELSTINSQPICRFSGIYIRSKLEIRMTNIETLRLRFVLRSFISHYCSESVRSSILEK